MKPDILPWETIVLGKASAINEEGECIGFSYVLYFQDGTISMGELSTDKGEILPQGWYNVSMEDYYKLAVYTRVIQ